MRRLLIVAAMLIAISIRPAEARFLSKDPVGPNPQNGSNFNRYYYANNNPYRYYDPDGRYVCSGSKTDCRNFDKAILQAKEAAASKNLSAEQRGALSAAVAFYGEKGDDRITVGFGALKGDFARISTDRQGRGSVTFDLNAISNKNPGSAGMIGGLAMRSLHEGDHGVRIINYGPPATRQDRFQREQHGYRAEAYYQKAMNFLQNSGNMWAPWNPGDGFDARMIDSKANRSVESSCYGYTGGNC